VHLRHVGVKLFALEMPIYTIRHMRSARAQSRNLVLYIQTIDSMGLPHMGASIYYVTDEGGSTNLLRLLTGGRGVYWTVA